MHATLTLSLPLISPSLFDRRGYQWRRLNFFDRAVMVAEDGSENVLGSFKPTCSTSGRGHLIFGTGIVSKPEGKSEDGPAPQPSQPASSAPALRGLGGGLAPAAAAPTPTAGSAGAGGDAAGGAAGSAGGKGVVLILNRNMARQEFVAYEQSVIAMRQLQRTPHLVTIGNDAAGGSGDISIKIWRLDQESAEGSGPMCAKTLRLTVKQSPLTAGLTPAAAAAAAAATAGGSAGAAAPATTVTCFAVAEDLSQLAVGFSNGSVVLLEAKSLVRDRSQVVTTLINDAKLGPVTSLFFREVAKAKCLYIVAQNAVYSVATSRTGYPITQLDWDGGAVAGCATVTDTKQLVTAREAVYFYDPDERGVCYGLTDPKRHALWFGSYLCLVTADEASSTGQARDVLTIYDLKNKFVAYSAKLAEPITHLLPEWGSLQLVTARGQITRLTELDLPTKMEALFKKNLYPVAIALAETQDCDRSYIMELHQLYGDHLYAKGDYDQAVQQYLTTVSHIEPSYVIRKFMEAQRINNLTMFLQGLHDAGRATADHTTLLLSCFTKLRDVGRLNQFVQAQQFPTPADAQAAIRACRATSYVTHALYLARKHGQHALYVAILVEQGDEEAVLDFLGCLPAPLAAHYLSQFGGLCAAKLPDRLAKLCTQLCTAYRPSPMPPLPKLPEPEATEGGAPAGSDGSSASSSSAASSSAAAATSTAAAAAASSTEDAPFLAASPDAFVDLFVDHPAHLERFLRDVTAFHARGGAGAGAAAAASGAAGVKATTWLALLEVLLRADAAARDSASEDVDGDVDGGGGLDGGDMDPSLGYGGGGGGDGLDGAGSGGAPSRHAQIMSLLREHAGHMDVSQALMLVETYRCEEGLLYLYGQLHRYRDILNYHVCPDHYW